MYPTTTTIAPSSSAYGAPGGQIISTSNNSVLTASSDSRGALGSAPMDSIHSAGARGIRESVARQAIVTMNAYINTSEMEQRANTSGRRGSVIPGTDISQHDIDAGQPVFAWLRDLKRRHESMPSVFGSLNGINCEAFSSSYELRLALRSMGIAATPVNVQRGSRGYNAQLGLAVQCGGSITIANTGKERLNPGDLFMVGVPYFDKRRGVDPTTPEWVRENAVDERGRIAAHIQRFDDRATTECLRHAYYHAATALADRPTAVLPLNRHMDPNSRGVTQTVPEPTRFALAELNDLLCKFLAGVRALAARGVLRIMTPQRQTEQDVLDEMSRRLVETRGNIPRDEQQRFLRRLEAARADDARTDAERLQNMRYAAPRAAGEPSRETSSFDEFRQFSEDERREQDNDLLWLALRCGVVGPDPALVDRQPGQEPANALFVTDILHCFFCDMIPQGSAEARKMRARYAPDYVQGDALYSESAKSQLERVVRSGGLRAQQTLTGFVARLMEQVAGVVLRGGPPGGTVDVLLTGMYKG